MYYPYVYGRQYDLIALDQVADKIARKRVVTPIIEPVVINPRDVTKTLKGLLKQNISTVLVLNPSLGNFKTGSNIDMKIWDTEVAKYHSEPNFIPALKISANTQPAEVSSFLAKFKHKVALIHWAELDPKAMTVILAPESARVINIYLSSHTSASYRQVLPGSDKVLARDGFNKAERNADYTTDEFFDDLITTYNKLDKMDGFSDFTITGSDFKAGGGPAAAVAIHLTYEKTSSKAIWIRHFVSDDVTIPPNDVNLKIGQCLRKFDAYIKNNPTQFSYSDAVKKFIMLYRTGATTSLAKLKQMSIEHHIELMDYLL